MTTVIRCAATASSDIAFHSAIAEATHNRALIRVAQVLIEIFAPSRDTFFQTRERAKKSLSFHKRILESIEAHSPVKAQRAMSEHIKSVDQELLGTDGSESSHAFRPGQAAEAAGGNI